MEPVRPHSSRPDPDRPTPPESPHTGPQATASLDAGCPRQPGWMASIFLLAVLAAAGTALATWKVRALQEAETLAAQQPEPVEFVTTAVARPREHQRSITSIGTVLALRSTTLRNELPGTVREVLLAPGEIVEAGTLLVALDVSVEEAELKALEAQVVLAETLAGRVERAVQSRATSQVEWDRARADLDVARAQMERLRAVIARKTVRAPFRARLGLSDVHPGQYLEAGTLLTTLQGVDAAVHVDFAVPQQVAEQLAVGEPVTLIPGPRRPEVAAGIVALDARIDPRTRNTLVRARVEDGRALPGPGASVRVRVPAGESVAGVAVPVSAVRKGPEGDHVFVVSPGDDGKARARVRRVRTGPILADEALIVEGLEAGETVAAFGSFKLREGVLVAAAGSAPGAATN